MNEITTPIQTRRQDGGFPGHGNGQDGRSPSRFGFVALLAAICAATALTPSFAATPITNTIDGVEWRFMLDTPSGTNGTAMLGINTATSGNTDRGTDSLHGCPAAASVNAANIPWEFDYDGVHYTVTKVALGAFYGMTSLAGIITIPPAVTEIRNHAFQGCSGLTGFRGGDSVTTWGTSAFNSCNNMVGVYPDFLIASGTIGETAFYNSPLTGTLKLGSQVTTLARYAFRNCFFSGTAVIPANVNTIGTATAFGAFDTNPNLNAFWIKGKATAASQNYTTVYCSKLAAANTSLKMMLMGQNTKGGNMKATGTNAMLVGCTGVHVFVPANGYWDELVLGGTNNTLWYYGPTNEFNLVVDDNMKTATFTPTTVNALTNAIAWSASFKEYFDLDPRISVTNALDLAGATITEEMVEDLTFDRLMFMVKTQAELDGILDVFPSDAPLAIDPSGITENLTIPLSRKVFVQLSEADAVRLKAKGFAIIFR